MKSSPSLITASSLPPQGGASAIGAPPAHPWRQGGRTTSKLGNFHSALLGRLHSALTIVALFVDPLGEADSFRDVADRERLGAIRPLVRMAPSDLNHQIRMGCGCVRQQPSEMILHGAD